MQKESYYSLICECISDELILNDSLFDKNIDFIRWRSFAIVELLNTILYYNLSVDIIGEKFADNDFVNFLKNKSKEIISNSQSVKYSIDYKNGISWGLWEVLLNVANHYKPYEFKVTGKNINIAELEKIAYWYMWNS